MDKKKMLTLRLDGFTYQQIANKAGVSRQRVQQILSPPKEIRDFVVSKYEGRCVECDIFVGKSGHIHHENSDSEHYNDINNLELLCISCHRARHWPCKGEYMPIDVKSVRKALGLTQMKLSLKLKVDTLTVSRWERGVYRPSKVVMARLNRLIKKNRRQPSYLAL